MSTHFTLGICSLVLCAREVAGQEGPTVVSTLERLAARAAVERAVGSIGPNLRVVIDPMIVHANEAPGGRDSTPRSAARNTYLAQALGVRVLPFRSVLDCSARPCRLRDADVLVSLSQPAVVGDDASVTVTTLRRTSTRLGTQYRTVNVRMKGQGAAWRVVGFEELGIS